MGTVTWLYKDENDERDGNKTKKIGKLI